MLNDKIRTIFWQEYATRCDMHGVFEPLPPAGTGVLFLGTSSKP